MKDKLATAQAVLAETAEQGSVGEFLGEFEISKGAIELRFDCTLRSYKSWYWSVVFTQVDKRKEATVSEINLLASEGALLAPAWVPWAERLAEFRKQLKESGRVQTDAEADELIRDLTSAFGDHGEANESEANTDQSSVKPPVKARVRQRRIKRAEDHEDQTPSEGAE
ncbi:DUF3027 domain-containing protein [Aquiluna sp. KACHI24]|uniref:DUF3027 domain-containing protein n=1 Tax=Aquiluna sp. KACHI24 TaxID=2968831 RepID=UPI00220FADB4|nr:DUF3027 domain-containing protein [Aquiluna sp. KACHI24]BDQ00651.1 hypothetical protein AKACHI_09870 [Aquiluna sp. KACHI24]